MDLLGLLSAVAAVVSLVGAGFAWWRSNLSRKAKAAAERAEREASEALAAARLLAESMERQAESMEQLVASIRRPPLSAEHVSNMLFRLNNDTDAEATVEEVVNVDDFLRPPFDAVPFTMPPRGAQEFLVLTAWGHPTPTVATLRTREHGVRHVRLPPRP